MPEISTAIKIGIVTNGNQLEFDLKDNLKRIGYRDLITLIEPEGVYQYLFNESKDFVFIDYVNDTQLLDYVLVNCIFNSWKEFNKPMLPMTRDRRLIDSDLQFFKLMSLEHVLATPFTMKSLAMNVIGTWQKFFSEKHKKPTQELVEQIRGHIKKVQLEEARLLLPQIASVAILEPVALELKARIAFADKNRPEAFKIIEDMKGKFSADIFTAIRVSSIMVDYEEFQPVLDLLGTEAYTKLNLSIVYLLRGTAYFRIGTYEKAVDDLKLFITIQPKHINANNMLAVMYKELKAYTLAIQHYSTILKLNPANYKIKFNIALLYVSSGDTARAKAFLTEIVKSHPEYDKAKIKLQQLGG